LVANAELVAATPGDLVVLDGETANWRASDGSRRELINTAEAAALQHCATFAPLDFHAQQLARATGWTPQQAAGLLAQLASRGLVRSAAEYLGALDATATARVPDPTIVIRAYQRPEGLAVLLDSLLADERRHGARRQYVVVDDTLDDGYAAKTYGLVRKFAGASASSVRMLGLHERAAALDEVLAPLANTEREIVAELLDPARPCALTGSRTWNWAVLLAAGGSLSILDDDTRFPLRTLPASHRAFDLLDATESVVRWFDEPEAPARELPELDVDPYARLADWVGQPAQALLARDGWNDRTLVHRSPRELAAAARNARVIAAVPGTYGTITLDSSVYLTYPAESIHDLWRAPYRHARLASDALAQGYEAPRLTSFALYTPLLVDARELLPFAGTWGRVDDTYFLMLLRAMAPKQAYVHAPLLLGHADFAPRDRLARATGGRIPLDRNAFVSSLALTLGDVLGGADREARLAAVGASLAALATAPDDAIADLVLRWRTDMTGRVTRQLDGALRTRRDAPAEWRAHAERIVKVNRDAIRDDRVEPDEIRASRAAIAQLAKAAPLWPKLWHHARELGTAAFAPEAR